MGKKSRYNVLKLISIQYYRKENLTINYGKTKRKVKHNERHAYKRRT
jgi:hypothetical protein